MSNDHLMKRLDSLTGHLFTLPEDERPVFLQTEMAKLGKGSDEDRELAGALLGIWNGLTNQGKGFGKPGLPSITAQPNADTSTRYDQKNLIPFHDVPSFLKFTKGKDQQDNVIQIGSQTVYFGKAPSKIGQTVYHIIFADGNELKQILFPDKLLQNEGLAEIKALFGSQRLLTSDLLTRLKNYVLRQMTHWERNELEQRDKPQEQYDWVAFGPKNNVFFAPVYWLNPNVKKGIISFDTTRESILASGKTIGDTQLDEDWFDSRWDNYPGVFYTRDETGQEKKFILFAPIDNAQTHSDVQFITKNSQGDLILLNLGLLDELSVAMLLSLMQALKASDGQKTVLTHPYLTRFFNPEIQWTQIPMKEVIKPEGYTMDVRGGKYNWSSRNGKLVLESKDTNIKNISLEYNQYDRGAIPRIPIVTKGHEALVGWFDALPVELPNVFFLNSQKAVLLKYDGDKKKPIYILVTRNYETHSLMASIFGPNDPLKTLIDQKIFREGKKEIQFDTQTGFVIDDIQIGSYIFQHKDFNQHEWTIKSRLLAPDFAEIINGNLVFKRMNNGRDTEYKQITQEEIDKIKQGDTTQNTHPVFSKEWIQEYLKNPDNPGIFYFGNLPCILLDSAHESYLGALTLDPETDKPSLMIAAEMPGQPNNPVATYIMQQIRETQKPGANRVLIPVKKDIATDGTPILVYDSVLFKGAIPFIEYTAQSTKTFQDKRSNVSLIWKGHTINYLMYNKKGVRVIDYTFTTPTLAAKSHVTSAPKQNESPKERFASLPESNVAPVSDHTSNITPVFSKEWFDSYTKEPRKNVFYAGGHPFVFVESTTKQTFLVITQDYHGKMFFATLSPEHHPDLIAKIRQTQEDGSSRVLSESKPSIVSRKRSPVSKLKFRDLELTDVDSEHSLLPLREESPNTYYIQMGDKGRIDITYENGNLVMTIGKDSSNFPLSQLDPIPLPETTIAAQQGLSESNVYPVLSKEWFDAYTSHPNPGVCFACKKPFILLESDPTGIILLITLNENNEPAFTELFETDKGDESIVTLLRRATTLNLTRVFLSNEVLIEPTRETNISLIRFPGINTDKSYPLISLADLSQGNFSVLNKYHVSLTGNTLYIAHNIENSVAIPFPLPPPLQYPVKPVHFSADWFDQYVSNPKNKGRFLLGQTPFVYLLNQDNVMMILGRRGSSKEDGLFFTFVPPKNPLYSLILNKKEDDSPLIDLDPDIKMTTDVMGTMFFNGIDIQPNPVGTYVLPHPARGAFQIRNNTDDGTYVSDIFIRFTGQHINMTFNKPGKPADENHFFLPETPLEGELEHYLNQYKRTAFSPKWFRDLEENDPQVFFVGDKKYFFMEGQNIRGKGLWIITESPDGSGLEFAFSNDASDQKMQLNSAILKTQEPGASRHLPGLPHDITDLSSLPADVLQLYKSPEYLRIWSVSNGLESLSHFFPLVEGPIPQETHSKLTIKDDSLVFQYGAKRFVATLPPSLATRKNSQWGTPTPHDDEIGFDQRSAPTILPASFIILPFIQDLENLRPKVDITLKGFQNSTPLNKWVTVTTNPLDISIRVLANTDEVKKLESSKRNLGGWLKANNEVQVEIRWGRGATPLMYTAQKNLTQLVPVHDGPQGRLFLNPVNGSSGDKELIFEAPSEMKDWMDQSLYGPHLTLHYVGDENKAFPENYKFQIEFEGHHDHDTQNPFYKKILEIWAAYFPKLVFLTDNQAQRAVDGEAPLALPVEGATRAPTNNHWKLSIEMSDLFQSSELRDKFEEELIDLLEQTKKAYAESISQIRNAVWNRRGEVPSTANGSTSAIAPNVGQENPATTTGTPSNEVTPPPPLTTGTGGSGSVGGPTGITKHKDFEERKEIVIPLDSTVTQDAPAETRLTFHIFTEGETGDQLITLEKILVRGEKNNPGTIVTMKMATQSSQFLDLPTEITAFPLQVHVTRFTKEPKGLEDFTFEISDTFQTTVTNYHHNAATKVVVNNVDPFSVSLDVLTDSTIFHPIIMGGNLTLNIDPDEAKKLGLNAGEIVQLKLDSPLELKGEKILTFPHTKLGDLSLKITLEPDGTINATRTPMEHIWDIELGPDETVLTGITSSHFPKFHLEPIVTRSHYFEKGKERHFHIKKAEVSAFVKWLDIVGIPHDFDTANHTDMEVVILDQPGKPEIAKIAPFRRNADNSIPVRSLHLSDDIYRKFISSLDDQKSELPGAAENRGPLKPADKKLTALVKPPSLVFAPGEVLVPTPETLDWISKAFGNTRSGMAPFRQDQRINERLEFEAADGVIISVPVTWTNRQRFPFNVDTGKKIETYVRGHETTSRRAVDEGFVSHDQGGNLVMYLLTRLGNNRVKAFNLKLVSSRLSPVLGALVNTLNEQGEEIPEQVEQYRKETRDVLQNYLFDYFTAKNTLGATVPYYIPDPRILKFKEGDKIEVNFVSPEGEPVKAHMEGLHLSKTNQRLDFNDRLTLVIEDGKGKQIIELQHKRGNQPDEIILWSPKTEINQRHGRVEGEAPTAKPLEGATRAPLNRKFVWNLRRGTLLETKPTKKRVIDETLLLRMVQRGNFPQYSRKTISEGIDKPEHIFVKPQLGTSFRFEAQEPVPLLSDKLRGFVLPTDNIITPVPETTDGRLLIKKLDLAHQYFLPVEETLMAQSLNGAAHELMTFIAPSGIILQIPMTWDADKGRYFADEEKDSVYGVSGARLLIPNPDKPGHYLEVDAAFHEKTLGGAGNNVFELEIDGGKLCYHLHEVGNTQTHSGKKVFGFRLENKNEDSSDRLKTKARTALVAWTRYMGIHQAPALETVSGRKILSKLNDGRILELGIHQDGEGQYVLKGLNIEPDEFSWETFAKISTLIGDNENHDDKHWHLTKEDLHLFKASPFGSLYHLFDTWTDQMYNLIIGKDGQLKLWKRPHHVKEFLNPPEAMDFPMVGLDGIEYKNKARSIATRIPLNSDDPKIQKFQISTLLGRWKGAIASQFVDDAGKDIERLKYEIHLDANDELSAHAVDITDEEVAAGHYHPFGKNPELKLVEDTWKDAAGNLKRGKVRIFFRNLTIVDKDGKQKTKPYGWMEFENREALIGDPQNFRVQMAHFHKTIAREDTKLFPEERGALTKRAGVSVDKGIFDEGMFHALGLAGVAILDQLKTTQASFDKHDWSIFMGALQLLNLHDPEKAPDDEMLKSVAHFGASLNPDVKPDEIIYQTRDDEITDDSSAITGSVSVGPNPTTIVADPMYENGILVNPLGINTGLFNSLPMTNSAGFFARM